MATPKTSKNSALKLVPSESNSAEILELLRGICLEPQNCPKKGGPGVQPGDYLTGNHFAFNASQANTDLARAAQSELEKDIYTEDENYYDLACSSEFQKLQQTFVEEVQMGTGEYALLNLVWRAYNAGLLSS
jgi:hypothetical protein